MSSIRPLNDREPHAPATRAVGAIVLPDAAGGCGGAGC